MTEDRGRREEEYKKISEVGKEEEGKISEEGKEG